VSDGTRGVVFLIMLSPLDSVGAGSGLCSLASSGHSDVEHSGFDNNVCGSCNDRTAKKLPL
jgi:hypothetical protein